MKQRNWHPWLIKRYVQVLRNDIIEEDPLNMFSFFSWLRPSQGCESHLQRALANIVGELYIDSRNRSVHSALKMRWSKMSARYADEHIFSGKIRHAGPRLDHTRRKDIRAHAAVASLWLPHPRCISAPQTLIRTNGTRVHALRNTEREIPREGAREQRPERDPDTDMGVLSGRSFPERAVSLETGRASCFHLARGWSGFCFVSIVAADSASLF